MKKILSAGMIKAVQTRLEFLNWACTSTMRMNLLGLLKGIEIMLPKEIGLTFRLRKKEEKYNKIYYVSVEQYSNYTDCYSKKTVCAEIYEKEIIIFQE